MKKILLLLITTLTITVVNAQVKVSSSYPNLDIKIRKCQLQGDKVYVEMLITNTAAKDDKITLDCMGMYPQNYVIDDEGNKYSGSKLSLEIAEGKPEGMISCELPSDIPMKIRLTVDDVDVNAAEFKIISFLVSGNRAQDKRVVTIKNIPINKD